MFATLVKVEPWEDDEVIETTHRFSTEEEVKSFLFNSAFIFKEDGEYVFQYPGSSEGNIPVRFGIDRIFDLDERTSAELCRVLNKYQDTCFFYGYIGSEIIPNYISDIGTTYVPKSLEEAVAFFK